MIVSASRRTDIPALYSGWLVNRLRAGQALVPDRFRPGRLYRIDLRPEAVDCLVLWTKNPAPMLDKLGEIEGLGHGYYLQYTLNPYGPPLEGGLPPLSERLAALEAVSRRIGPRRVVWRYDPVVITPELGPAWHVQKFQALANRLAGLVERAVVSFVDAYRHQPVAPPGQADRDAAAAGLAEAADKAGLEIFACAEGPELAALGLPPSSCVDPGLAAEISGREKSFGRDRGQRPLCLCAESRDIGMYQSCVHGCLYCYATTSRAKAAARLAAHDPLSPILIGRPPAEAAIVEPRLGGRQKTPGQALF
jgi:hypothetical protein